ncbi:MAG: hypothetical protein LUD72_12590 [Bacteroidales bacterium]|nr:hypothetical protein [Bacteroidales bacterium]
MRVKDFLDMADDTMMVRIEKSGKTVIVFDSDYSDGIIDDILNLEIASFKVESVARKRVYVTLTVGQGAEHG